MGGAKVGEATGSPCAWAGPQLLRRVGGLPVSHQDVEGFDPDAGEDGALAVRPLALVELGAERVLADELRQLPTLLGARQLVLELLRVPPREGAHGLQEGARVLGTLGVP